MKLINAIMKETGLSSWDLYRKILENDVLLSRYGWWKMTQRASKSIRIDILSALIKISGISPKKAFALLAEELKKD
jgi:hypothetical protein